MSKFISSTNNDIVKRIHRLQHKSRERKKDGYFVVEGVRELSMAIKAGFHFQEFIFCDQIIREDELYHLQAMAVDESAPWIGVSKIVYEHLAHRKSTEGVLGIAISRSTELNELELSSNPLILVAEASEKPGNIGALLRTADAANIDAVIIANPLTDLYNPNIIRSSLGCVFTTQIATASTPDIIGFLRLKKVSILAAALADDSSSYYDIDFKTPIAIVVGTEATGLSDEWLEKPNKKIIIPMEGKIDSLNVSVSAAILIFEAKRQRRLIP